MKAQSRLQKLERAAVSVLPPDGAALNRKLVRLTDVERKGWLERRTDKELDAMIRTDGCEPLVRWTRTSCAYMADLPVLPQSR